MLGLVNDTYFDKIINNPFLLLDEISYFLHLNIFTKEML